MILPELPGERFTLFNLIEPSEELALIFARETIARLEENARKYNIEDMRLRMQIAREEHHSNPSESSLADLESVVVTQADLDNSALRYQELRKAAKLVQLQRFREDAQKPLFSIFQRAIDQYAAAIVRQQSLEAACNKYYGQSFLPGPLCQVLESYREQLTRRLEFLSTEAQWGGAVPSIDSALAELGIFLPEPSEVELPLVEPPEQKSVASEPSDDGDLVAGPSLDRL